MQNNKTTSKPKKPLFLILVICFLFCFAIILVAWYMSKPVNYTNTNLKEITKTKPLLTEKQSDVNKNSDLSFQELLRSQCKIVGSHDKYPNVKFYGIDPNQLPFVLSDNLKSKYNIDTYMICDGGGSGFESAQNDNILFVSAEANQKNPRASILIGDDNSQNLGYFSPQLSFEDQYEAYYKGSREPFTLTNYQGVKTIISFSGPEAVCPREDGEFALNTLVFLTYGELDKYKILVSRIYPFPLNNDMKAMFLKYASKVDKDNAEVISEGDYELCDATEFVNEFFKKYFSSYDKTAPQFKKIIDENIIDVKGVSIY